MSELKIDLSEITSIATEIRKIETDMKNDVNAINIAISKVNNTWNTSNMDNLKKKFDRFITETNDFFGSLEAYSAFMEQATGIFEQVENSLKKVLEAANNADGWK